MPSPQLLNMDRKDRHFRDLEQSLDRRRLSPQSKTELANVIDNITDSDINEALTTMFRILTGEQVSEWTTTEGQE